LRKAAPFRYEAISTSLLWLPDGTLRFDKSQDSSGYYAVRSHVSEPAGGELLAAPALDNAQLRKWKSGGNARLASLLDTGQGESRAKLREIAEEILATQGLSRNATPARKAQGITNYLHETCEYSLNPPLVPAVRMRSSTF
jgi:transglutaminase-like putative cysteine protease